MVAEEIREYQGANLVVSEVTVLEALEEQFSHPILQQSINIVYLGCGFIAENNHIIELSLDSAGLLGMEPIGELRDLTKSIGRFRNLRRLRLSYNQLQSLPESIGGLQSLEELYLRENRLETLPPSLGQLQNLRVLDLQNNQLQSLPGTIGRLRNLRKLNLGFNLLKTLPETIGQLQNLQKLDLGENQLHTFSPRQQTLDHFLRLEARKFLGYGEILSRLSQLQELNLSYNNLCELPDSLGQCQSLKILYLEGNQLSSLPVSLGLLRNLQVLNLHKNRLRVLPTSLGQLKNLHTLNLAENLFDISLSSMVRLVWLTQKNPVFKQWIPHKLFTHPLVRPLKRDSITSHSPCPFCGAPDCVSGRSWNTHAVIILCLRCENIIQADTGPLTTKSVTPSNLAGRLEHLLRELDEGEGVSYEMITQLVECNNSEFDDALFQLLMDGKIYECRPARYRLIDL
ncbi:MAG: leucine-rich repeat domain-containing protein [Candidatus Hodarchaeota archaeon]